MIPGKINRCLNTDYLVRKIAPYTYQARKDECLDLPSKSYKTVYYDLDEMQDWHYQQVADALLFEVNELEPETIYRLFSGLQSVISGFRVTRTERPMKREPFFKTPYDNPRIKTLLEVLDSVEQKIIIFCKYTDEIETITAILNKKYGEGKAVPFYGELNQEKRQKNIDVFRNDAQFLVANKVCAGYGLNLQFCSYVVYYSNDWDFATRAQSEDRVHRIGQDKNVHIIDICAADTLDERILDCLWRKESLVDSFKSEIEKQKDNKKLFVENYIYRRDYKGRIKVRGKKKEEIREINDLKEDSNGQDIH